MSLNPMDQLQEEPLRATTSKSTGKPQNTGGRGRHVFMTTSYLMAASVFNPDSKPARELQDAGALLLSGCCMWRAASPTPPEVLGASGLRAGVYVSKDTLQREMPRHPPVCTQTELRTADLKPCSAPADTVTALLWKREGWRWLFLAETSRTLLLPEAGRRQGSPGFWSHPWWDLLCWQGWGSLSVPGSLRRSVCSFPSSWGWDLFWLLTRTLS